jgi:hypothetical protein
MDAAGTAFQTQVGRLFGFLLHGLFTLSARGSATWKIEP